MATITSSITPLIFQLIRQRTELNVLDLGTGVEKTMRMFEPRKCRFYFADIGRHVSSSYLARSSGMFPFSIDEALKFDVCLFWDYLNVMSNQAFEQFTEEIKPLLTTDTILYGFVANSHRLPMYFRRYALANSDELEILDLTEYTARYPKSRQDFEKAFAEANILNTTRYPDNRQELLATFS